MILNYVNFLFGLNDVSLLTKVFFINYLQSVFFFLFLIYEVFKILKIYIKITKQLELKKIRFNIYKKKLASYNEYN